ncbi:hypothetical protein J6590_067450 [Homalodisca vitripennis]|nr:hypothetical protein J6590_067450 [Homalodisca vitripennis]
MVLTRAKTKSHILSIDEILKDTLNLDDVSETLVTDLCMVLNKLKVNYPEIELDDLESTVARLIASLSDAVTRGSSLQTLLDTCQRETAQLESKYQDEKTRRISDFNDSITAQDVVKEEKDSLAHENSCLKSRIGKLKDEISLMESQSNTVQRLLSEKESFISNLENQIERHQRQNVELISVHSKLAAQLRDAEEKSWHNSRWQEDKIIDSYFESFADKQTSKDSETLFFGPSVTQFVKLGDSVSPTDQPDLMKVQLKPASLEAGGEQSDELGWVTVQTSSKIHPSTSLDVSFEHNNPYSILSSLDESEPPCEVVGLTPRGPRECRQRDWCGESARTSLKQKLNARALPALLYRHPTGASVFIFNKVGSKMFFSFFLYHLRGLGCMERCQMLDLEEGQYISQYLFSLVT